METTPKIDIKRSFDFKGVLFVHDLPSEMSNIQWALKSVQKALEISNRLYTYYMAKALEKKIDFDKTPEALKDFYMREGGRYDMQSQELFNELSQEIQPWNDILNLLSENECKFQLVSIGCVVSPPGSQNQNWHIDGVHNHKTEHLRADRIIVFIPLVDITEDNGCTEIIEKSHIRNGLGSHFEAFASMPSTLHYSKAGEPIIMDYRTWHRGLANRSQEIRPLLYFKYQRKLDLKKRIDTVTPRKKKRRITPCLVNT